MFSMSDATTYTSTESAFLHEVTASSGCEFVSREASLTRRRDQYLGGRTKENKGRWLLGDIRTETKEGKNDDGEIRVAVKSR